MASLTGNPYLDTYGAASGLDNDPIGFRDLVLAFRNNLSLESCDYMIGQANSGAAGLNVGDQWYVAGGQFGTGATTTFSPTAGTLYALPFFTGNQPIGFPVLNGLAVNVTTGGAGSNCRVGLYTNVLSPATAAMYPQALVAGTDSGNLSSAATGFVAATLAPAVPLAPNSLYWVVFNCSATAPVVSAVPATQYTPIFGYTAANPPVARIGWTVAFAFAAMPATFPAAATLVTVSGPAAFLRLA